MKRVLAAIACLTSTVMAGRAPTGSTAVIDRAIVFVDGSPIWQSELDEHLAVIAAGKSGDKAVIEATIEAMIDDQLLLARLGPREISDDEIDRALDQIKQQNGVDDAGLDALLASQHVTRPIYRLELARQLRLLMARQQELTTKVVVSEDEIKRAYAELKAEHPTVGTLDAIRETLRSSLTATKLEAAHAEWLAKHRKLARIDRRAP
jgi:parvulin-like peptidyl-prolyl isomerase